jgi:hypothetical protein
VGPNDLGDFRGARAMDHHGVSRAVRLRTRIRQFGIDVSTMASWARRALLDSGGWERGRCHGEGGL